MRAPPEPFGSVEPPVEIQQDAEAGQGRKLFPAQGAKRKGGVDPPSGRTV